MSQQPINGHGPAQPELQIPVECTPQAIPTVGLVNYDPDRKQVVLVFLDATGQRYVFMPPEYAINFGEQILKAAGIARSGLIVPPGGLG